MHTFTRLHFVENVSLTCQYSCAQVEIKGLIFYKHFKIPNNSSKEKTHIQIKTIYIKKKKSVKKIVVLTTETVVETNLKDSPQKNIKFFLTC